MRPKSKLDDDGRALLCTLCVILLLTAGYLVFNPHGRTRSFACLGQYDWAFQHLTTIQEKCDILNDARYYAQGKPFPRGYQVGSELLLFPGGTEWLQVTNIDPFEVKVTDRRGPLHAEQAADLERLDENRLLYHARDYPICITVTRMNAHPGDGEDMVRVLVWAEVEPR